MTGPSHPTTEVVLVRHATTPWSATGRHTSRTEILLDERGRAQAAALRDVIPPGPYVAVLGRPRQRAVETSELAGFADPTLLDDLTEWDYGEAEGVTTPELREQHPGWSLFVDGPPGGEPLASVAARVDRVIERLRATPGRSIVFAHGHLLRVLAARWIEQAPEVAAHLGLDAAGIGILGYERETPVILVWNRVASIVG